MAADALSWIEPDWPVPRTVRALTTARTGGVSRGVWSSLNLGAHVGDDPNAVAENRGRLVEHAGLPGEPVWLRQVHGTTVIQAGRPEAGPVAHEPEADAAVTASPGVVCAVLTADCLPVFLARTDGSAVGVAHAGWRGLAAGVLEAAVAAMPGTEASLAAWLGPAIGPEVYEVGPEVRAAFEAAAPEDGSAFREGRGDRLVADLFALARLRLARCGVAEVGGGTHCTYTETEDFFSHRRDGPCGRMASVVWLD